MIKAPAGFWIRLGALILDGILLSIVVFVIALLTGMSEQASDSFSGLLNIVYSIVLPVTWFGYTVGKRICGIRILKVDGSNVGVGAMLLRTIVAGFVYVLTIGIGLIVSIFMVIFRQDKRSLHDLIAGTYVTYERPVQHNPYE